MRKILTGILLTTMLTSLAGCNIATTSDSQSESAEQESVMDKQKIRALRDGNLMPVEQKGEANKQCDLIVRFGSYCCGPNRKTRALLDDYLAKEKSILLVNQNVWGMEGEVDYCITLKQEADRAAIKQKINEMIEEGGQETGPVSLDK
jgi:hypothetical protein